ncbi:MAG: hypothetical protein KKD28_03470 [Chloroflexi bacterium]|nr:hypothetical protein [Chloroflexota bacterium]MBU1660514.1 hypothetical protein [Chloroflexota bacterium]
MTVVDYTSDWPQTSEVSEDLGGLRPATSFALSASDDIIPLLSALALINYTP